MDSSASAAPSSSNNSERRPLRDRIAQHITRRKTPSNNNNTTTTTTTTNNNNNNNNINNNYNNSNDNDSSDQIAKDTSSSSSSPPSSSTPPSDTTFECNVCFDVPRDPVVTPCGHLYCWPCLYRWMKLHADSPQCPVCKAGVEKSSVIPIYGRGRTEADDPRQRPLDDDYNSNNVPPRPQGHRLNPFPNLSQQNQRNRATNNTNNTNNRQVPFGYNAFGGGLNAYAGNYDFSLGNFGIFPSFFGLQMPYPHINDPPRDDLRGEDEEEGIPELFAKFFLLLALIITTILTIF